MFGDRTDAMLHKAWESVPISWRSVPVFTDHWEAYARFFPADQHTACDKGSGLTSHAEGWNTKWRQRQSSLVRRSCGVHLGIIDDAYERFLILVDQHNRHRAERWYKLTQATQERP